VNLLASEGLPAISYEHANGVPVDFGDFGGSEVVKHTYAKTHPIGYSLFEGEHYSTFAVKGTSDNSVDAYIDFNVSDSVDYPIKRVIVEGMKDKNELCTQYDIPHSKCHHSFGSNIQVELYDGSSNGPK